MAYALPYWFTYTSVKTGCQGLKLLLAVSNLHHHLKDEFKLILLYANLTPCGNACYTLICI